MSKFEAFNVTTAIYKTVGDHPVLADIFLPKDIPAGPHPLILRFHGGALVRLVFSDATHISLTVWTAGQWKSQCRALFPHLASRIRGRQIRYPCLCGLSHDARVFRLRYS